MRDFARRRILRKPMKINGSQRSFDSGCALSSVVEHFLHTEGVAGSNPAVRTISPPS